MFNIEVKVKSRVPSRPVTALIALPPQVLLAVDYSVLLFYGQEHVQKYLLTFMNIVSGRATGGTKSRVCES